MVKLTLWLGFFLRLANSFVNGFYGPSFGAEDDAFGFHVNAVTFINQSLVMDPFIPHLLYSYILGIFYSITTDSLFLGSALSTLAWLASAFILVRIMRILSFKMSNQWRVILIYALIPSSLMYTSVTLREPFQLLFINLALYAALKIYLHRSISHWLVLFLAVVGMGALHGALFVSGIFMIIGTLFLLTARSRKGVSFGKVVLVSPIVILGLFYGFLLFANIFTYGERIILEGLSVATQSYQEGTMATVQRANYRTDIVEISGLGGLILSIPSFLFQYLFEPMPWKMSSVVDVVVLLENMLRFWLIWNALKYLVGTYRNKPMFVARNVFGNGKFIFFMFLTYLTMETIWSLGTTNWGTSTRHHIPSLGLLLVAGFAYRNVTSPKYNRSHKS
jgi:hypothetical protein